MDEFAGCEELCRRTCGIGEGAERGLAVSVQLDGTQAKGGLRERERRRERRCRRNQRRDKLAVTSTFRIEPTFPFKVPLLDRCRVQRRGRARAFQLGWLGWVSWERKGEIGQEQEDV